MNTNLAGESVQVAVQFRHTPAGSEGHSRLLNRGTCGWSISLYGGAVADPRAFHLRASVVFNAVRLPIWIDAQYACNDDLRSF